MRGTRRILLALALSLAPVALAPRAAHAQAAAETAAPAGGPRLETLRAGWAPQSQFESTARISEAAKGPFGSRANGRVAAIVGGAAFLGGLIIGDDAGTAIAVGGLVVGLLGLWTWLG